MNKKEPFKYEKDDTFDFTIDEKGNTFIALRRMKWGDSDEYKLDLRKYYSTSEGERMNKGVSFMTDDGPNELLRVLLDQNFGEPKEIVETIKTKRTDIYDALAYDVLQLPEEEKERILSLDLNDMDDDEFYDPREIMG